MNRVFTNAPSAYDYGYTTEVETDVTVTKFGRDYIGRVVEIPAEATAYQVGRYESGLYWAEILLD